MSEQADIKPDALPDLDDLLQCPVCYEIPTGQIFQCDEGHHVCGRCKMRLELCPVCRALFFGTRNYVMEELIAKVTKLQAFKLGGKITTAVSAETSTSAVESTAEVTENESVEDDESDLQSNSSQRAPQACKGLFRCLCCKNGNGVRLPAARLLNHLRYFHSPQLIEGTSENGQYGQTWQFSTEPGRIDTAVRVSDMGIFFLIIEINDDSVSAWLTMAASPWVAHEFCYTVSISGNDREAIFSDCVWSVRSCEGSLRKRGHCLVVSGADARALTAPAAISGKLSVRRAPPDQAAGHTQPRAVLRVANRGAGTGTGTTTTTGTGTGRDARAHDLEPFLQDLQNDVARLSRAFATLGREANALVRSEAEMRARIDTRQAAGAPERNSASTATEPEPPADNQPPAAPLSRNARRRRRQRLRAALNDVPPSDPAPPPPVSPPRAPTHMLQNQRAPIQIRPPRAPYHSSITVQPPRVSNETVQPPRASNQTVQPPRASNQTAEFPRAPIQTVQPPRASNQTVQPPRASNQVVQSPRASNQTLHFPRPCNPIVQSPRTSNQTAEFSRAPIQTVQPSRATNQPVPASRASNQTAARSNEVNHIPHFFSGLAIVQPVAPPPAPAQSSGPSNGLAQNENARNKKKRRQHR